MYDGSSVNLTVTSVVSGVNAATMIVMFVLGFFMDTIEIVLIVVPITAPVIIAMGINPVWLGVMIGVNLQTAFLTPPVGFALFYMRAVAPESITTGAIYRGIIPFVTLQIAGIAILWAVPSLATWLPKQVFPDAIPGAASGQPGSVLDDILKAPGPGVPSTSTSPEPQGSPPTPQPSPSTWPSSAPRATAS